MFEYHGWVIIQASAGDEESSDTRAAYDRVATEVLPSLQTGYGFADLRYLNGAAQLHLAGNSNHARLERPNVVGGLERVGAIAPGSYGLLYMFDDEDPQGRRNEFQVVVMRRGQLYEERDPFLSPCIPMVEDDE